jgi:hypothetical protein
MYNFRLGRKLLSKMHLYRQLIRVKRISSVIHPFRLSNLLVADTSTGFGSYINEVRQEGVAGVDVANIGKP